MTLAALALRRSVFPLPELPNGRQSFNHCEFRLWSDQVEDRMRVCCFAVMYCFWDYRAEEQRVSADIYYVKLSQLFWFSK